MTSSSSTCKQAQGQGRSTQAQVQGHPTQAQATQAQAHGCSTQTQDQVSPHAHALTWAFKLAPSSCTYISMCMNQMLRPLAATNYALPRACVTHGGGSVGGERTRAARRRWQRRRRLQPSMQVYDSLQKVEYSLPACKLPTGQQPTFWTSLPYSCSRPCKYMTACRWLNTAYQPASGLQADSLHFGHHYHTVAAVHAST